MHTAQLTPLFVGHFNYWSSIVTASFVLYLPQRFYFFFVFFTCPDGEEQQNKNQQGIVRKLPTTVRTYVIDPFSLWF